jgi:hypothetical protein
MKREPHDITSKSLDKIIVHQHHNLQFQKHYAIILPTFQILLLATFNIITHVILGYAVAQLIEALRYESEGRGFDSR